MNDEKIDLFISQCKKDIESLNMELARLMKEKDEGNIPEVVRCGQVFLVCCSTMMVVYVGGTAVGLTCLSDFAGCWSSGVLDGPVANTGKIRDVLVQKKAKYLGKFEDLFTRTYKDTE